MCFRNTESGTDVNGVCDDDRRVAGFGCATFGDSVGVVETANLGT